MRLCRPALLLAAAASLLACGDDAQPAANDTTAAEDTAPSEDLAGDAATADTSSPPACNPITQTGCPDDQNCTFGDDGKTPLCVAGGEVLYGDECGSAAPCARGICMSLNDTGYRCYKFCQTVAHCDAQASCLALSGVSYKVCEIKDLYDNCDLLVQDCADAKGCYVIANEPQPVCLPPGAALAGDVCDNASACAPGHLCINQRCKRICDPRQTDPCGNFIPCPSYSSAGYCDE